MDARVRIRGIERNRGNRGHDRVLLHVHAEEGIERELDELPEHADGHREAESDERHVDRRQVDLVARAVQEIDKREADRGAEKPVQGMEHGIPAWNQDIVVVDLAQNLCREDEDVDDVLEERRNVHMRPVLEKRRHKEEDKHKDGDSDTFPACCHDAADERHEHQDAQDRIEDERLPVERDPVLEPAYERADPASSHGISPFIMFRIKGNRRPMPAAAMPRMQALSANPQRKRRQAYANMRKDAGICSQEPGSGASVPLPLERADLGREFLQLLRRKLVQMLEPVHEKGKRFVPSGKHEL